MKRLFPVLAAAGLLAALLLWAQDCALAVGEGLALCARSVIPALFPFFAASGLLIALGGAELLGTALSPLLLPLLGCGAAGSSALLLGLIGGYPTGGRSVGELCRSGRVSREEGQRLLLFCNNSGPAFVLGVAGLGCFGSSRVGAWLYLIHVGSALLTALLLRRRRAEERPPLRPPVRFVPAFLQAVQDAASAMLRVCAFVIFFLVLLRLLTRLTGLSHPALLGAIELTRGILLLENSPAGFRWAAALLSWGGLCVHCQTAAVLSGSGLRMGPYLLAKAAQAALSALLAWPVSLYLWG